MEAFDFNLLPIFINVFETQSFTESAKRLNMTKAKVSLGITRLEARTGHSLFRRTTRQVVPTDTAKIMYEHIQPLLSQIHQSMLDQSKHAQPHTAFKGRLRISCTAQHLETNLAQVIMQFAQVHPEVYFDIYSSDEIKDPVREGIDVSFRVGWLNDSSQRAVQIGKFSQQVVASPSYWRTHAPVHHPSDLAQHPWIALSILRSPLVWSFSHATLGEIKVQMRSQMRMDTTSSVAQMALSGYGVSIIDSVSIATHLQAGELQAVLNDWQLPQGGIYAVYPPGKHISAIAQAFVALYRRLFKDPI